MASSSGGVWLTIFSIWRWDQTSFSPGATLKSPAMIRGSYGSRAALSFVRRS